MRSDIQASLDAIKAPAQAIITKVDNIVPAVEAGEQQAYDEGKAAGDAEGYARGKVDGIEEGRASIVLPEPTNPDAQYTQAQMDEAVSTRETQVRAEMQISIDSLNAQVTEKDSKIANLENQVAQFGPQAEELNAKVTALTTERDALRAAIQAEIDDSKQDTSRLEAALPAPAQV